MKSQESENMASFSLPENIDDPADSADNEGEEDIADEREGKGHSIGNTVEFENLNIKEFPEPESSQSNGDGEHKKNDGHEYEIIHERDGKVEGLSYEEVVKNDVDLEQKSPKEGHGKGLPFRPVNPDDVSELEYFTFDRCQKSSFRDFAQ